MITVTWMSNFGNNMFQWAVLYAVSKKTGIPYTTDGWHGEATARAYAVPNGKDIFNLPEEPDFSLYQETNIFHDSDSMDQRFNPEIFNIPDGTRLRGYFQTDKYFIDYREDILKYFTFKDKSIDEKAKNIINEVDRKIIVCAHSREGDYVTDPGFSVVNENYFKGAIKFLLEKLNASEEDLGVIFISDNKTSTKLNFLNYTKIKLVQPGESNFVEMSIMKQANHCITANSSFSWWGAWLNQNNPIIVSPERWVNFDMPNRGDLWLPRDVKMSIPNQFFINKDGILV